jgi:hypothetical protein
VEYKTSYDLRQLGNLQLQYQASMARRPGESDQDFGTRIHQMANGIFFSDSLTWLDGKSYHYKSDNSRFGRSVTHFVGWGELRKQKKSPHTEVLYVWSLSSHKPMGTEEPILVLRSINNCTNDQLRQAIQLAALRLEQKSIQQADAEFLLDRCYAELQRRLEWTDREKEKRGKPQEHQDQAPVECAK